MFRILIPVFIILLCSCKKQVNPNLYKADIIIYGATSAGVIAGVQASRMGKTVLIIEPSSHIGGLTTSGLGQTDIGNKQVIGGISHEFYIRIAKEYENPRAWNFQSRIDYEKQPKRLIGHSHEEIGNYNGNTMWTFEPKIASKVFQDLIEENNIRIIVNERLDLKNGVIKKGTKIQRIKTESGREFSADIYIDATYEGDLMALSGVSYTVGREGYYKYGETLNGVRAELSFDHRLPEGIDPFIIKGEPASGRLPGVNSGIEKEGTGDEKVQAYCFRMVLTDVKENMIPIKKPENYNEFDYELLFRCIDLGNTGSSFDYSKAGYEGSFFKFAMMPNRKTDSNNEGGVSTDFIGRNYDYPDGNYETRRKIIMAHETYQKGLIWTLCNHSKVPQEIRKEYSKWGLPKDEFVKNENWPPMIYIREARRMVSDFVMTQYHCTQDSIVHQSIGMGAYTMDSHNVQRYVNDKGYVQNEGDVQVGGFGPYPISYKAITPKIEECTNLLVPICLSASHIAYGSIRMEPVFMVIGQSAAAAACLVIDGGIPVQKVPYSDLKKVLELSNQILSLKK